MTTAAVPSTSTIARDRTTVALYAALGVFGAIQVVPGAATPFLRAELGYSYVLASLHASAFAAGAVVAGVIGPRAEHAVGRRGPLVLSALVAAGIAIAGMAVGRTGLATLPAAWLAGVLGAAVLVSVQAALSDHHSEGRTVAFAEANAVASAGAMLAPLAIGAAAGGLGSWRWGVVAVSATAAAVAVTSRRVPFPGLVPGAPGAGSPTGRLPRRAWAGITLVFAGVVLEWGVAYWGATYLRDVVGLGDGAAVSSMTAFFAAMLGGRVVGAVLARRLPADRVVRAALALVGAGVVSQAVSTAAAAALAGLVLLGAGASVLFPFSLSLAVQAAPTRASLISSRCVTAGSAAVLVGPVGVGALADAVGLRAAMLVVPLALALAVVALTQSRPAHHGAGVAQASELERPAR